MMGQSESSFKRSYSETVCKLSSVQLGEIASRFNELYARAGGPKGHLVDREAFSQYFKLPATVGDRLFDAFDEQKVVLISLWLVLGFCSPESIRRTLSTYNIHYTEWQDQL